MKTLELLHTLKITNGPEMFSNAEEVARKIEVLIPAWTKVEDGLPEGDIKSDWLVKEISAHPHYQRVEELTLIRNLTGNELAERRELMADEWFQDAYWQPITPPEVS